MFVIPRRWRIIREFFTKTIIKSREEVSDAFTCRERVLLSNSFWTIALLTIAKVQEVVQRCRHRLLLSYSTNQEDYSHCRDPIDDKVVRLHGGSQAWRYLTNRLKMSTMPNCGLWRFISKYYLQEDPQTTF